MLSRLGLTKSRGMNTTRAEQSSRNKANRSQRPRCVIACPPQGPTGLSKEPRTCQRQAGVSTYLALTFGTLLSSQGTDASFVLTRRTFPGAFLRALPFGLAFPTLSDSFVSESPSDRGLLSSLSTFRRFRPYQILSGLIPGRTRVRLPGCWAVPTSKL
jgi:hypothetical protein